MGNAGSAISVNELKQDEIREKIIIQENFFRNLLKSIKK
jgi:hypothetical protein